MVQTNHLVMSDERSLFPSWEKIKELPNTETGESRMLIKVILLNLFICNETHNLFLGEVMYIHDEQKKV